MNELIKRFTKRFSLAEIFSQAVVKKYGDKAWQFIDPRLMEVLLWVREGIGMPMVINTKDKQQRGFRENTCEMVADYTAKGKTYCSAHVLGKGVDFNIAGNKLSANDIRKWIRAHVDSCPWPIRIENDKSAPTWCHIDVMNTTEFILEEFGV